MSEKKVFACPSLLVSLPSLPQTPRFAWLGRGFVLGRRSWWVLPAGLIAVSLLMAGKIAERRRLHSTSEPSKIAEKCDDSATTDDALPQPQEALVAAAEGSGSPSPPALDGMLAQTAPMDVPTISNSSSASVSAEPPTFTVPPQIDEAAPLRLDVPSPPPTPGASVTQCVNELEMLETEAAVRLNGHTDVVSCAAFVPGQHWLISAGHDCSMRLWDLVSSRELHCFEVHATDIHCLAVTRDGKRVLTGSGRFEQQDGKVVPVDCTLHLWDLKTGQEIRRYTGHQGPVTCLALSPDGHQVLSASHDHTVRLWDLETGREIRRLEGHSAGVQGVCFSADGRLALSAGGTDRTLRVWDLDTGRQIQCLHQRGPVKCVLAMPDGRHALSAGGAIAKADCGAVDCEIHIWDLQSVQEEGCLAGHTQPVMSLALCADGKHLLSGGLDGSVRMWDIAGHRQTATLGTHGKGVWSVAASPDGSQVASTGGDRIVQVWRLP